MSHRRGGNTGESKRRNPAPGSRCLNDTCSSPESLKDFEGGHGTGWGWGWGVVRGVEGSQEFLRRNAAGTAHVSARRILGWQVFSIGSTRTDNVPTNNTVLSDCDFPGYRYGWVMYNRLILSFKRSSVSWLYFFSSFNSEPSEKSFQRRTTDIEWIRLCFDP